MPILTCLSEKILLLYATSLWLRQYRGAFNYRVGAIKYVQGNPAVLLVGNS